MNAKRSPNRSSRDYAWGVYEALSNAGKCGAHNADRPEARTHYALCVREAGHTGVHDDMWRLWGDRDATSMQNRREAAADYRRMIAELEVEPEPSAGGLESWLVLRMGTHERLAQFSDYDEAISFARKLHQGGAEVQVMTGYNAPDPVAVDTDTQPPRGWCPECDGPSQCPPGTCPGVGAPEAAREIHRLLDPIQDEAKRLGFCCYAAALAPNGPCPWHAATRRAEVGLPPCPHGNDLASECTDGCRP